MNGDNGASFEEVTAKAPSLTQLEFDTIDLNDNNMWDANEKTGDAQALLVRYMQGELKTQDDFTLDTDKDGMVSMAEVNAVAGAVTQSEFNDVDTNDNNQWDPNELNADAQGLCAAILPARVQLARSTSPRLIPTVIMLPPSKK